MDISWKKIYKWLTNIWKNAQHHYNQWNANQNHNEVSLHTLWGKREERKREKACVCETEREKERRKEGKKKVEEKWIGGEGKRKRIGKGGEKFETVCAVGRNVKQYNSYSKDYGSSSKN